MTIRSEVLLHRLKQIIKKVSANCAKTLLCGPSGDIAPITKCLNYYTPKKA